jgi:hypothetical protein
MADLQNPTPATPSVSVESEEAAKLVYDAMVWAREQQPGIPVPKWIDGGNSDAQYEARRVVRKIAELAPNPSPAAKSGEAEAVDLHRIKWSHMPSYGEMSMDQLREAVSEAGFADRHHLGPFDPSYSKGHQQIGGCNYNSLNRIVTAFVRSALTEPAPAGEAVEPVSVNEYAATYYFAGDGGDYTPTEGERAMIEDAINGYLAAHPAPENALRLREDFERVTRRLSAAYEAKYRCNEDANAERRVRLAAERDRDDARKELETAREDSERLNWFEANMNAELLQEGGWNDDDMRWSVFLVNGGRNDREWNRIGSGETVREAIDAARSASREATR